jgi:hypothetical protein
VSTTSFGFLFAPAVVGIIAQLRRPARNVAGMVMALIPWTALLLAAFFSGSFGSVVLFNPSRLAAVVTLFRPFSSHRPRLLQFVSLVAD